MQDIVHYGPGPDTSLVLPPPRARVTGAATLRASAVRRKPASRGLEGGEGGLCQNLAQWRVRGGADAAEVWSMPWSCQIGSRAPATGPCGLRYTRWGARGSSFARRGGT